MLPSRDLVSINPRAEGTTWFLACLKIQFLGCIFATACSFKFINHDFLVTLNNCAILAWQCFFLTRATCKKLWHKSYTLGHCLGNSISPCSTRAAPLRGIAAIATLERFVVYCLSELIISGSAPGRWAQGIAQAVTASHPRIGPRSTGSTYSLPAEAFLCQPL